jgi:hypothetical protein
MPSAVNITQQPQSTTNVVPAQSATFSVVAMGTPPLSYQWYYSTNGSAGIFAALADQTNTSLVLSPVLQTTNAGFFFAVVTNGASAATSSVAALTIYRAPVIARQPAPTNLVLLAGTSNTFSVAANAALPVYYFWRTNGSFLPGATSAALTFTSLQVPNSATYSAVVSNAYGSITSSLVALTVLPAPTYPYAQLVLAAYPVSYWRLDETAGTVAYDCFAGNNGIYNKVLLGQTGNPLLDTHKASRFGSLASANSLVTNMVIDFATSGSATFSIEAWVNGGTQSADNGLVTKGTGGGGEQFNLDCGGSGHAFRFFVRDITDSAHLATSTVANNNKWHHLVGVCDQVHSNVVLYVDGANAAQTSIIPGSGILSSACSVSIGSRQSAAASYDLQFVGLMEEVAIYNYALSSSQVQAHYGAVGNRAPVFVKNPFAEPDVNAGQLYSGTVATNATDPNGDSLTFAKVSGLAWLSVVTNGTLSGTPANSDSGTNSFVVQATDPGGFSGSATMYLYVNGAPSFINNPFTESSVNAGQLYASTIAANAIDPNGDPLTFAKISGPAWLSVASNGTLSGTPANSDSGTNSFVLQTTDPGGLSGGATMYLYVNGAPSFINNPFTEPGVNAGQLYSGTVTTNAIDRNGDPLTFAKVSGPGWLNVASDGTLSGTPVSSDAGSSTFVLSATDPGGLSASATLNITVSPAPPLTSAIVFQGSSLLLSWSGGIAPCYQVQTATNLAAPDWQPVGTATSTTNLLVSPTNTAAFYRILGQ